ASGSTGTVSGADQTQQQSPTESSSGGSPATYSSATSTEASAGSGLTCSSSTSMEASGGRPQIEKIRSDLSSATESLGSG
ncbi:hypothetical protein PC123_g21147, partial [Phytophthora cactorum]